MSADPPMASPVMTVLRVELYDSSDTPAAATQPTRPGYGWAANRSASSSNAAGERDRAAAGAGEFRVGEIGLRPALGLAPTTRPPGR